MVSFTYYRMKALPGITGVSRAQLYGLIKRGEFVPSTQLSTKCVGFRSDLVQAWMESRPFRTTKGGLTK